MRCAKGITLEVGQQVSFDTWDETDPANPVRVPATGTVTALSGEVARNQTLGEVSIGALTLPAAAVSVIPSATPAPAASPAKPKSTRKKK